MDDEVEAVDQNPVGGCPLGLNSSPAADSETGLDTLDDRFDLSVAPSGANYEIVCERA